VVLSCLPVCDESWVSQSRQSFKPFATLLPFKSVRRAEDHLRPVVAIGRVRGYVVVVAARTNVETAADAA
jgi:hypothetical protein